MDGVLTRHVVGALLCILSLAVGLVVMGRYSASAKEVVLSVGFWAFVGFVVLPKLYPSLFTK